MEIWQLTTIIVVVAVVLSWLLWFLLHSNKQVPEHESEALAHAAQESVERIFDNEFREELRNRGQLYFKKIISENAMFLQQDLRLTTSQLSDYMKEEVNRNLKEQFDEYSKSIATARDLALETIQKTQASIEQQRQVLEKQLVDEVTIEKKRALDNFDKNMAIIINHYLMLAISDEINIDNQLDYVLKRLEENKAAILEDIRNGT